jgi:hypothetical protein
VFRYLCIILYMIEWVTAPLSSLTTASPASSRLLLAPLVRSHGIFPFSGHRRPRELRERGIHSPSYEFLSRTDDLGSQHKGLTSSQSLGLSHIPNSSYPCYSISHSSPNYGSVLSESPVDRNLSSAYTFQCE